ncbi:hypothetical protein HAX54_053334 [Datura stramonium]|uniref:Uncharacterized protein n=1 Tax=Datura stramonium TaxID=4076 RepID=A0ABS8RS20_DATST|nr:hypothetical protein [Datura stramonium]
MLKEHAVYRFTYESILELKFGVQKWRWCAALAAICLLGGGLSFAREDKKATGFALFVEEDRGEGRDGEGSVQPALMEVFQYTGLSEQERTSMSMECGGVRVERRRGEISVVALRRGREIHCGLSAVLHRQWRKRSKRKRREGGQWRDRALTRGWFEKPKKERLRGVLAALVRG